MPLLDHLRELRQRVLRSAIAVLLAFGGGWYFYNPIISTLAKPVCDLKAAQEDANLDNILKLVYESNPEKLEASYGKLVPILVKAVQELAAKVEQLEGK